MYSSDNLSSAQSVKCKLILFDGTCGLCHGWVRFVIRFDNRELFQYASIQSDTGQSILNNMNLPKDSIETLIYIEQGVCYFRSQACLMVIRKLAFPVSLLYVSRVVPKFIRDRVYNLIARNRYKLFGRREECSLTDGQYKDRFI